MMTDLAPANTHETFLANSMAEEAWRLNQIRARCANLAAVGDFDGAGDNYRPMEGQNAGLETAVIDAVVARDHSKELALMSLYSQRTQRAYEKYRQELNELQEKRKADNAAELEEARLLFQLADTQGLDYDPKKDGIVFSLPLHPGAKPRAPPQANPREKNRSRLPEKAQPDRNHPSRRQSCLICHIRHTRLPCIRFSTPV